MRSWNFCGWHQTGNYQYKEDWVSIQESSLVSAQECQKMEFNSTTCEIMHLGTSNLFCKLRTHHMEAIQEEWAEQGGMKILTEGCWCLHEHVKSSRCSWEKNWEIPLGSGSLCAENRGWRSAGGRAYCIRWIFGVKQYSWTDLNQKLL